MPELLFDPEAHRQKFQKAHKFMAKNDLSFVLIQIRIDFFLVFLSLRSRLRILIIIRF